METVYKLTIDGTYVILFVLSDVFDIIKEYEFDEYEKGADPLHFHLEIGEMTEEEIKALPEFEGF